MKKILKAVFVIIGTLIGAGFASGQEIYLFFFSYGTKGLIGIIISSGLIGLIIYKYNIFTSFINFMLPKKPNSSMIIHITIDKIISKH